MLKPAVQVRNEGGFLVAEFWDCLRLDPAPVQDLRKHFENHLRDGGKPELVVDLLGVAFAGSAALSGFLTMSRLARQRGGRLVFCNVDPTVFEVLRVSKLQLFFQFAADRPAALALVSQPAEPSETADPSPPGSDPPNNKKDFSGPAPLRRARRRGED
jgi:anti-anti-sigma factor